MAPGGERPVYDRIGRGYALRRRPDPRIAALFERELGPARRILNVGAGTGSYEPAGREVVALELSATMLAQRPAGAAPAVRGSALVLPFAAGRFDATLALLTLHHWSDARRGLAELARVSRRQLIFCIDPAHPPANFWLARDYLPEIIEADARLHLTMDQIREVLGPTRVIPVPIPHDCSDGFLCAYWRRPAVYLDPGVRRSISMFSLIGDVEPGLDALRRDLADGSWERRNRELLARDEMDYGYRLVIAGA